MIRSFIVAAVVAISAAVAGSAAAGDRIDLGDIRSDIGKDRSEALRETGERRTQPPQPAARCADATTEAERDLMKPGDSRRTVDECGNPVRPPTSTKDGR